MKYFVTFGQTHLHQWNDVFWNRNCVATFDADSMANARQYAFNKFDDKWHSCKEHTGEESDKVIAEWYPRGEIPV